MTDLRSTLEREAARVWATPDARVRVQDRVEQRGRRRRAAALALGLAVAIAGIGGVLVTIRSVGSGDLAGRGEWTGIWPQASYGAAAEAQEAADAGDPGVMWQLDGRAVVERFATGQLGWSVISLQAIANAEEVVADVGVIDPPSRLSDPATRGPVRVLAASCEPAPGTSCAAAYVTVQRLLRDDPTGIWLVTDVDRTWVGFPEPTRSPAG